MSAPAEATAGAVHPVHAVRAAVEWSRGRGLRIRLVEEFGVVCISTHAPRWEVDPSVTGPNPVGAAILMAQPECSDLDEAAALALGVPLAWVEGLAAGVARAEPSKTWATSVARHMYLGGFEAGLFVRSWLMRAGATSVGGVG
jgi:hypothetical protein